MAAGLPSYLKPAAKPAGGAPPAATSAPRTAATLPAYLRNAATPTPTLPHKTVQPTVQRSRAAAWGIALLRTGLVLASVVAIAVIALGVRQRALDAQFEAQLTRLQPGMTRAEATAIVSSLQPAAGAGEESCYAVAGWTLIPGTSVTLLNGRVQIDPPPRLVCLTFAGDVLIRRDS